MAEEALIRTDAAGNADPRSAGSPLRQRFGSWSQRQDVRRWLAIGLACAAVISGAITYATLSGSAPFGPGPQTILILLNIDLVLDGPLMAECESALTDPKGPREEDSTP